MTLIGILLVIAGTFGILFALIGYSLFLFQLHSNRQFEQKFQDANQIILEGRPPTPWAQRERNQVHKWRNQDKNAVALARVGERAKQRCLHQLHALIDFLENGRFYDSLETRELIVERLWEIHGQWLEQPWEYFIDSA